MSIDDVRRNLRFLGGRARQERQDDGENGPARNFANHQVSSAKKGIRSIKSLNRRVGQASIASAGPPFAGPPFARQLPVAANHFLNAMSQALGKRHERAFQVEFFFAEEFQLEAALHQLERKLAVIRDLRT